MGETNRTGGAGGWFDDGSGRTDEELALIAAAALLSTALVGVLRVLDAVLEAWPLPTSRVRT